ncbi:MAG: hypothetical protein FGM15_10670 [Chthoniobacterales bacterium]|nr:hypothetical protein [Chthoniobacterales bacterium]
MAERELQMFVGDCLARGASRDDVARGLRSAGWPEREIHEALDYYIDAGLPLPVPKCRASAGPREAFLHLLLFASLATWATALGSLLFDFINIRFPLLDGRPVVDFGSIRFGVAALVVAFPVFALTLRRVKRDITANPARGMNPVRRWLTYIALFVAALILLGDAIGTVVSFLNGELTIRFVLKAAVIAALAGGVTWWLLRELREKIQPLRPAWYAVCLAVIAAIAAAVWVTGGPLRARLEAQDEQRVRDLLSIYQSVNQFYQAQKRLPATLEECNTNPGSFVADQTDPVTGGAYEYEAVDKDTFTLRASFDLPSREDRGNGDYSGPSDDGFWRHEAGETTFTIEVGPPNQ